VAAEDGSFRLGMGKTRALTHPLNRSCHAGGRGFESRRSRPRFGLLEPNPQSAGASDRRKNGRRLSTPEAIVGVGQA